MKLRNKILIATFLILPSIFCSGSLYSTESGFHKPDVTKQHGGHHGGRNSGHNGGNHGEHHRR